MYALPDFPGAGPPFLKSESHPYDAKRGGEIRLTNIVRATDG